MTLHLADRWLWDFWIARDGSDYHVFYLQADRALGNPDLRHWHPSIGHAVSQDLTTWEILPDALRPAPESEEAWDNFTTWTGSIIRHDNRWYMFYTGANRSEKGLIQRIELATSEDLINWEKSPDNPLLEADSRWYELLDLNSWHDQAWRDPCVFRDPETGLFHALVTARARTGAADARGVIGHATSSDLYHWEVLPPVTKPGDFGHMEVPQLAYVDGRYYLLFSVPGDSHSRARLDRLASPPPYGTHYLVANHPLGPFRYLTDEFMVGDPAGRYYSGKLIQAPDTSWKYMAFSNRDSSGQFIGDLSVPMPVEIRPDGRLIVQRPED